MENKEKRIPKYCFEIPLSGVDYIYQSSFSHIPVVVMKPLLQPLERIPEETKKLKCMKCGRTAMKGESFNSNKDGSFVECDDCMWKVEPLQNGEREEVCSICGGLLDSDSYAYGGKYPTHIACSLNAKKIYIGSKDKKGELKPSEYLKDLLSQSKKEGDIASDFLYWHPIGGGFPDQSIKIGVAFEPCSGCHEDFGFIIEKDGKRISAGISLKDAISKARMELESLTNQKKDI